MGQPKNQKIAILLALAGTVTPFAGLHKFYVGQPLWGIVYLLLFATPIPHVASGVEAVWYLLHDRADFDLRFNGGVNSLERREPEIDPNRVSAIASAVRELDRLRQEGLISEYEFEEKRRQLLDRAL
ncbi:NINE protein [Lusitaniella coriacea]|uniref:NINE protein n=1 Tax=Lusitaniella coriacea TaxID=1983105 RepID=UPI001D13B534|nr:NINE protein [Lusitaniella coriacea]